MNITKAINSKMPKESPHHPCEHIHTDGRNCAFVAPMGRPFCEGHKNNKPCRFCVRKG